MSAAPAPPPELVLDGASLTAADVARVARNPHVRVRVDEAARQRVRRGRAQIDRIVETYRRDYAAYARGERPRPPVQDYGVTTGFGEFKDVPVAPAALEELQRNLLLSHSVGVGDTADDDDANNFFAPEVVRATLLVRANAFLGGHSGVREELLDTVLAMLHAGVVPRVPTRGSMGSSGDLCPLAHLFVVLLGEGHYELAPDVESLRPGAVRTRRAAAAHLAEDLADALAGTSTATPAVPESKEGLALINGATVSVALLALAVADAGNLADVADIGAALSLEASCGCARALDPKIHAARGHPGQIESARRLRRLVDGSTLMERAGAVQDAYSLRCAPVVHGAARDAIAFARALCEREINAATDNPLFFPETEDGDADPAWDHRFAANWPADYDGRARASYSAGNFHGQPVALAADALAIAVAELANISERRSQLLLDRHHSRNLPANLIAHRGVRSGYMLAQYSAASLVAENKVLAHPASVDSIPTSANIEDHVAVATTAARKLRQVTANVEAALAIELMVAAQAIDWRVGMDYPPRAPHPGLFGGDPPRGPVHADDGPERVEREARLFVEATRPARRPEIAAALGRGSSAAYRAVRKLVEPMIEDRVLAPDIVTLRRLVASRRLVETVDAAF
ncbi:MAG: aromatic amino acid lyase [Acidobacteriota bacterium]